jgi:hypothetical protein
MATALSRYKLENLIKSGKIHAKRVDEQTVLIELDSVRRYINSLPDVTGEKETEAHPDPAQASLDHIRQALDGSN